MFELGWNTHSVLDHGFVHLRDSMPREAEQGQRTDFGTGDARVVEAARISTNHLAFDVLGELGEEKDHEVRTVEQDMKLLRYMFKNGHTTPFEQVRFTFVAKLPIMVARQWVRHRTGSFNEQSARYGELTKDFYVPEVWRMQAQSTANKQGSAEALSGAVAGGLQAEFHDHNMNSYNLYQSMLEDGLTRELARMVLPTNIYTKWYWTTDLHNLFHYCSKRCARDAQYEIRAYAMPMLYMASHVAPFAVQLFLEQYAHTWIGEEVKQFWPEFARRQAEATA